LSGFNPGTAEAGVAIPCVVMFAFGFYSGGGDMAGCYERGLSKVCHKCVSNVHKGLIMIVLKHLG